MSGIIDWNKLKSLVYGEFKNSENPEKFWSPFAEMYDKMSKMEREFTKNQIEVLDLKKDDIVFDIGCGTGRLSIPIAKKVKKVISLDVSNEMLNYARSYAREEQVENIDFHKIDWHNESEINSLEKPDIVIVSRTEALKDIERLTSLAKKRVYMLCFANGPSLREIQLDLFKGIDGNPQYNSNYKRELGYNIDFNRVYDMGIDLSIAVVKDGFEKIYTSKEEAYEDLKTLGKVEKHQEGLFRENVNKYLSFILDEKVRFLRETSSYVMWWDTK